MSNSLAIATVTEALKNLLTSYLDLSEVSASQVSTLSPDAPTGIAIPGINVFLYQISPNAALRNQDLPTRLADGTLLRKPQAAVDLHYLLTFYGDYATLEPQRLLGAATVALHANPVLSQTQIQALTQRVIEQLQNAAQNALPLLGNVANGLVSTLLDIVLILVLSIYFLVAGPRLVQWLRRNAPVRQRSRLTQILASLQHVIGGYLRGQLILSTLIAEALGHLFALLVTKIPELQLDRIQ